MKYDEIDFNRKKLQMQLFERKVVQTKNYSKKISFEWKYVLQIQLFHSKPMNNVIKK